MTRSKEESCSWLRAHAPKGTKIFSAVQVSREGTSKASAYFFAPDAQGELFDHWLNRHMDALEIIRLDSEEFIVINEVGNTLAREIAERLGRAVWDDPHAYTYKLL